MIEEIKISLCKNLSLSLVDRSLIQYSDFCSGHLKCVY